MWKFHIPFLLVCYINIDYTDNSRENLGVVKAMRVMSGLYEIREAVESDINAIVRVYNSNDKFLVNHLGMEAVDDKFVFNEMLEMKAIGFLSCVIIEPSTNMVIGVLDYKPDDTVYLSLLMIDSEHQKCGVGRSVYHQFEKKMHQLGKSTIRIDVVNDYIGNAEEFWKKQGFISVDKLKLKWGQKQSMAVVMVKSMF